uniref:Uncharacterized protein n=1 Tax=Ditylenchus dipsaci TaxID=166011 RepID=A0A915EQV8_9BILA
MQKTAANVQLLVESKLGELGLNQWSKLFVTTDEGSNVNAIGGEKHQPCLCHIGSTMPSAAVFCTRTRVSQ